MMQLRFGPQEVGLNTPSQVSEFKSTLEGSARDPFMPSKPHVPNYLRGRLASLGNDGILELFALNAKITEIMFSQWD